MTPTMRAHRWAMAPAEFRKVLRALALRYCTWDLTLNDRCRILPESLVLSLEDHERIVRAVEGFARAFRRFEARVRHDPSVAAAMGISPGLFPLLAAGSAGEPAFSRADFYLTQDGRWVISEFNEDVPGGFNEAVGIPELVGEETLGGRVVGALKEQMVASFRECDAVAMVFATGFSEDLQHCALLARWLEEAGHATVLASPEQLAWRRGPRVGGKPVDGVFRFYPGEWMTLLPNLPTWVRALPRLRMMNPLLRLLAQSKRSFAVWQTSHPLDPADPSPCETYLPHTELYDARQHGRYRDERGRWVLKRAFGRMGDAVTIGALTPAPEWDRALAFADQHPHEHCIQERFQVAAVPFEQGPMYPTVGAYVVDGRFAGYYSRVSPQPFITGEAYHVATVVEDS